MISSVPDPDRSTHGSRPGTAHPPASGTIAFFISPHGYGHAARCCAVLEALTAANPGITPHLFTTVPHWFLERSLSRPFLYHRLDTDVGLVQRNSLDEDPAATAAALDAIFPPAESRLDDLAETLRRIDCRMILADISPLGLAVAQRAGVRSVLLENFTWDWIYRPYLDDTPALARHMPWLEATFAAADHRIQAQPFCQPVAGSWVVPPISREPRTPPEEIRRQLGVGESTPLVLVSMGGVRWRFDNLDSLAGGDALFVVPGGAPRLEHHDGLILLPHRSDFFHPDLVGAADVVIGKLGYSTVAEAYRSGAAYLFVRRPNFAESAVLERFVVGEMSAGVLAADEFRQGHWRDALRPLLAAGRAAPPRGANGAEIAADHLGRLLAAPPPP